MFAALVLALAAQDPPSLAVQVNRAIARGVENLRKAQATDGSWGGHEKDHPGGMTALCAFTLLKSGVRRTDDALEAALKSVQATKFESTYSHSVRLLLYDALAQPDKWRKPAQQSLDFLVENQFAGDAGDPMNGQWAYPSGGPDASNTQFALLGLRAAKRLGLELPDETLAGAAKSLFRLQARDGGFQYRGDSHATGGITAATLAGLCVLRELADGRPSVEALLRKSDKQIELAHEWMVAHWDAARNAVGSGAWTPGWQYPYLWAVERYGGLSNQARLGQHDWYAEGAQWLVDDQNDDGGWGTATECTCFALLFLRRATVTVDEGGPAAPGAFADAPRRPRPIEPAPGLLRLTDWLLAGPWHGDQPHTILLRPPFDPKKANPKPGDKLARREWARVTLRSDGWTNLDEVAKEEGDGGMYGLATTLAWNSDEPLEATLWLELEDGWDVYLDGARLSSSNRVAAPIDGRVALPLTLSRGEHLLLCLVEDDKGSAAFGARLSDRAGKKLSLDPETYAVRTKANRR